VATTTPAIKVATIPRMAMDKGDRFPVSFTSWMVDVGSAVFVALGFGVTVVGITVMIFV
jgi:hypothetical protein